MIDEVPRRWHRTWKWGPPWIGWTPFRVHDKASSLPLGGQFDASGLRDPVEPPVGYRLEFDGKAVVFAGDTLRCPGLEE